MTYTNKLCVEFDFAGKYRHESRSDYIARSVEEVKEKSSALQPDIVKIFGTLLGKDVDLLQRELGIEPVSKVSVSNGKYSFTFVIPSNKL